MTTGNHQVLKIGFSPSSDCHLLQNTSDIRIGLLSEKREKEEELQTRNHEKHVKSKMWFIEDEAFLHLNHSTFFLLTLENFLRLFSTS